MYTLQNVTSFGGSTAPLIARHPTKSRSTMTVSELKTSYLSNCSVVRLGLAWRAMCGSYMRFCAGAIQRVIAFICLTSVEVPLPSVCLSG